MKRFTLYLIVALSFLLAPSAFAQEAQSAGDQLQEIPRREPATISGDRVSSVIEPAETLDDSIDVGMKPGVTRSFTNVRIGGYHPESSYFDEILEKPDFMTFRTDAVRTGIFVGTLVDFTLTSDANAPEGKFIIRVKYNFHFGVPPVSSEILTLNLTIADFAPPMADFTAKPTSGQRPLRVQFTDSSSGVIESRSWDFGDGFKSTEINPSHFYTTASTYTVSLKVIGPGGDNTKTRENYITVTEPPPFANFTGTPRSGVKPLTVQFTDLSSGQITSHLWDFGDGQTSTEKSPSHVYASVGTYTVSLTVTGPGGSNTRTQANYITVREPAPVADFDGAPTSGTKPLTVQFTDKSTGQITSRSWNFGDGQTSTVTNPVHTYANAGTYTVSLTVSGPGGTNTKSQAGYIVANEPRPTANFSATPTSGAKPLTVQFTDLSSGQITVRLWNFGDGQTSSATSPSHIYTEVGSYTVMLTVAGPGGSDTTTKANYITVTEPAPVADFTGSPTSGVKPLTVQFTDKSTGAITDGLWSFGDGQTSTRVFPGPVHTYKEAGSYTVTLTVTGPGGSNTKTQPGYITVNEPVPVANFTAVPTSGVKPLTVQFLNSSAGVITGYAWNFGDGQSSTETAPVHTYANADTYTVALTVTGPGGSHTKTREKYIIVTQTTAVDGETGHGVPTEYALEQNYPNPFNPETEIGFSLPKASHVVVKIYNITGQEVRTLADQRFQPGNHSVRWNGRDDIGKQMLSGVYFYRLEAGNFVQTKKMVLAK